MFHPRKIPFTYATPAQASNSALALGTDRPTPMARRVLRRQKNELIGPSSSKFNGRKWSISKKNAIFRRENDD